MLVGDVVKMESGGCGCEFCEMATNTWRTIISVDIDGLFTLEGMTGVTYSLKSGTWQVLPQNLENE